ncbi:hypothetical protein Tco_0386099, partial [Tanacetum coccineum]
HGVPPTKRLFRVAMLDPSPEFIGPWGTSGDPGQPRLIVANRNPEFEDLLADVIGSHSSHSGFSSLDRCDRRRGILRLLFCLEFKYQIPSGALRSTPHEVFCLASSGKEILDGRMVENACFFALPEDCPQLRRIASHRTFSSKQVPVGSN